MLFLLIILSRLTVLPVLPTVVWCQGSLTDLLSSEDWAVTEASAELLFTVKQSGVSGAVSARHWAKTAGLSHYRAEDSFITGRIVTAFIWYLISSLQYWVIIWLIKLSQYHTVTVTAGPFSYAVLTPPLSAPPGGQKAADDWQWRQVKSDQKFNY